MATSDAFWMQFGPVLLIVLGILVLLELAWLIWLQLRLRRTMATYRLVLTGADGSNLEELLHSYAARVNETAGQTEECIASITKLDEDLHGSLQKVGVIRYNPFSDVGGDQSFAIALADARGNGFVLSSLHHRHRTQVYAKPLRAWASSYTLSEEETAAIEMARGG